MNNRMAWTFTITSIALFMVALDNLVITTAIPVIRTHLRASLSSLEWTVNAYTLTFAVLLLTGAAFGDRFGRRRLFTLGVAIFTAGSAAAALAPSIGVLNLARAVQGLGGSIVLPLTLTILSAAVPAGKRGLALGAWGGISGLAVALGPVVGGAIVQAISWQWIFWLNVPIGAALVPIAWIQLAETRGPAGRLDLPGLCLSAAGLLGIVWGLVRGNSSGWASPEILTALIAGAAVLAVFVAWERRALAPMLPMRLFRSAAFTLANTASLFMYFGMFGSIFLLSQFFQTVQHDSPLGSGLRILAWTIAPMSISPAAGVLSGRARRAHPHRHRSQHAGSRASLARPRHHPGHGLPGVHRAVPARRYGYGAVLRPDGQRHTRRRPARRAGTGLRCEQRHPGTRRRARACPVDLRGRVV